jgi:glycosyltransferase involved in cell wall biosynthesis
MIVKNESKVIRRCLESVRDYVDAWCISDTGSTDGTQEIIQEVLRGIPGKLLERDWVDFSTNRNEAIDAGLSFEPDWFMTLDADEEFTIAPGFDLKLEHDVQSRTANHRTLSRPVMSSATRTELALWPAWPTSITRTLRF